MRISSHTQEKLRRWWAWFRGWEKVKCSWSLIHLACVCVQVKQGKATAADLKDCGNSTRAAQHMAEAISYFNVNHINGISKRFSM